MFEQLGARIIDADEVARTVVQPDEPAWKEIVREFGEGVLDPGGVINRKRLADIVFSDEDSRRKLNDITHPRIKEKIRGLLSSYDKEGTPVAMIEATLIVERGGLREFLDGLIVVTADEETQIERLVREKGYTREEAAARLGAQMPAGEKMRHGDYVIDNSGALEDTRRRVNEVWNSIAA